MRMISSVGPSVGYDHGSAVSDRYRAPFPFSGTLDRIDIDADPDGKHRDSADIAVARSASGDRTPMTETTMQPDVLVDGRTARRDRNRELVLDAAIELFTENDLAPDAASVAERSGVSLRSVYRYFEDHDSLVRAAIARHAERIAPLLVIPDLGVGPFDVRVERLVAARMRLYEAAAPTARVAVLRAPDNPPLREQMDRLRATLRAQTEAMFEPELSAMDATRASRDDDGHGHAVAVRERWTTSASGAASRPPRPPTSSAAPSPPSSPDPVPVLASLGTRWGAE